jgi:hypothetical protein
LLVPAEEKLNTFAVRPKLFFAIAPLQSAIQLSMRANKASWHDQRIIEINERAHTPWRKMWFARG